MSAAIFWDLNDWQTVQARQVFSIFPETYFEMLVRLTLVWAVKSLLPRSNAGFRTKKQQPKKLAFASRSKDYASSESVEGKATT